MSNDKILLIYFWVCWTGTTLLPIACVAGAELGVAPVLICFFCTTGLPLACALCLNSFQPIAKLGMITEGLSFLISYALLSARSMW
jgi:hypothetical protein